MTRIRTALGVVMGAAALAAGAAPAHAQPASSLADAFSQYPINGYAYKTTYLPSGAPAQVRYESALIGVPQSLDVNGDGTADFTGTLGAATVNGVGLSIHRLDFPATGKVKIEAVFKNPSDPNSQLYIGAGEDGTTAGTAADWNATVAPLQLEYNNTDLQLTLSASGAPATLGTIGEVFSGEDPDAPYKTQGGTVTFTPVPANFTTRLGFGNDRQEVQLISDVATKVTGHVASVTGSNRHEVDLTIDQLPAGTAATPSIDVRYMQDGARRTADYVASGTINKVTGTYRHKVGSVIDSAARIDATGIPTHITVDNDDAQTTVTTDSQVTSLEARFAKGADVPAAGAGTAAYASFHRYSTSKLTGGIRLTNLRSATIDQSGPYGGHIVFATAPTAIPLSAKDDVSGITLNGSLSNLPRDLTLTADLTNGVVSYDGQGQAIGAVALHATRTVGKVFFGRVNRLDATISGIPAANTIRFKQVGPSVTLAADKPLANTITLLASNGAAAPPVTGSAAWYEDTPSVYRGYVKIAGLKSVSVTGSPVGGSIDTATPQLLTLHADTSTVDFDGTIDRLPAHLGFSVNTSGGQTVVDYDSNGALINKITFDAGGLPLPASTNKVHGEITSLPSHLTLTIPPKGGKIVFDPHGSYIGRVLLQAYQAGSTPGTAPYGHQLLEYDEALHRITVDVYNIGRISASTTATPLDISYDISHKPLVFRVTLGDGTTTNIYGVITNPQPARITFTSANGVNAEYHVTPAGPNFIGDGSIDNISLSATLGGGYLSVDELSHIPANLTFCLANSRSNTSCALPWIPHPTPGGHGLPDADFSLRLLPTNLQGAVPAQRITVSGRYCPSQPNAANCNNGANNNKRITIDKLRFNTVEAAFYHQSSDSCNTPCGTVWTAFNTNNQPITTNSIHYYQQGHSEDLLNVSMPASDSAGNCYSGSCNAIRANKMWLYLWYHPAWSNTVEHGGTFSCQGDPHAEIEIPYWWNADLLSGTFGIC